MVPHRAKAGLFGRSSILFRPHPPATNGVLVEPPGTAPGSEPIITGAFIAIDRVAPIKGQYRGAGGGAQGGLSTRGPGRGAWKIKGLAAGIYEASSISPHTRTLPCTRPPREAGSPRHGARASANKASAIEATGALPS